MRPEIVLVAAVAENDVIGAGGGLPWRVKADLRRFRAITMGKPMVMGRKTFESIGRVLDGRDNIVVTRDKSFAAEGVVVAHSIEEALLIAEERAKTSNVNEVCVIGGAQIFEETFDQAARLDITHIAASPEGNVYFPKIDRARWTEVSRTELPRNEGDSAPAVNAIYQRRS